MKPGCKSRSSDSLIPVSTDLTAGLGSPEPPYPAPPSSLPPFVPVGEITDTLFSKVQHLPLDSVHMKEIPLSITCAFPRLWHGLVFLFYEVSAFMGFTSNTT